MKRALIVGITGQDGAYLAELLLSKGYEVHGMKRRSSSFNTVRIEHLYQDPQKSDRRLILHYGDLTDSTNIVRIVQEVQPDEIYNLGTKSCCRLFRTAGIHCRLQWTRRFAVARGDSNPSLGKANALLSGLDLGAVWRRSRGPTAGNHSLFIPDRPTESASCMDIG